MMGTEVAEHSLTTSDIRISLRYSFTGRFYSKGMAANLVNLVRRNLDGLSKFPDHMIADYIPIVLNFKGALLDDFDDNFTRIVGGSAPFPFPSAQDCD
jgi:predicted alpha/beta-fold hydrolase